MLMLIICIHVHVHKLRYFLSAVYCTDVTQLFIVTRVHAIVLQYMCVRTLNSGCLWSIDKTRAVYSLL